MSRLRPSYEILNGEDSHNWAAKMIQMVPKQPRSGFAGRTVLRNVVVFCVSTLQSFCSAGAQTAPTSYDLAATGTTVASGKSVGINVNGNLKQVHTNSGLTAAEQIAVTQVLRSGRQSLVLGGNGNAVGGSFSITRDISTPVQDLVIPQNVTALAGMSSSNVFSFSGNLVNSGNLYVFSTNPNIVTGWLSAANIVNTSTGLISTAVPRSFLDGAKIVPQFNLGLIASNSFSNAGTVQSTGKLLITAGSSVINVPSLASGARPSISAAGDINFNTNLLVNSGLINSLSGNMSVQSQTAHDLLVNNTGGVVSALRGIIGLSTSAGSKLSVTGGDFLSRSFNLNSPGGAIEVNANNISGNVSACSGTLHVQTKSDLLQIGSTAISGDPTYYNSGNIAINGDISVQEKLTIIAGGSITSSSAVHSITAQNGGQGFDITLVAGASTTPACSTCSSNAAPGSEATAPVTVNVTGAGGGNIDLSASSNLVINAGSTGPNLSGANVTLVAFANGTTGGLILLAPASQITTSGAGTGSNGNATLIAGANSGVGISLGTINASGGSGTSTGTGMIGIYSAQPTSSNGNAITFDTSGGITSGNKFAPTTGGSAGGTITVSSTSGTTGGTTSGTTGGTVGGTITIGTTSGTLGGTPGGTSGGTTGGTTGSTSGSFPAATFGGSGTIVITSFGVVLVSASGTITVLSGPALGGLGIVSSSDSVTSSPLTNNATGAGGSRSVRVDLQSPVSNGIGSPLASPSSTFQSPTSATLPTDLTHSGARFAAAHELFLFDAERKTFNLHATENSAPPMDQVLISTQSGSFHLPGMSSSGTELGAEKILFAPTEHSVVSTSYGDIVIGDGAVVLIFQSREGLTLFDLADESSGDVTFRCGNDVVSLLPGQQVVLTSKSSVNVENADPLSGVAYRDSKETKLSNGTNAFIREFSIPSALRASHLYGRLAHTSDSKQKALLAKLLKSAAALQVATASRGPYHGPGQP